MKDYVASTLSGYFDWQNNLVTIVTTNSTAWNIDPLALSDLQAKNAAYIPLYNAIKTRSIRTPQQVSAHDTYKKTYTKFLRGFVQGHLVNNALVPVDEQVAMGLNPHLYIRTARPKIVNHPTIAPSNIGGGEVRFRCTMSDSDSKGRHPDSDGVELYFSIEPVSTQVNPVDPQPTGPGDPAPPTPDQEQFLQSIFSPRANFIHAFGVNKVGKVLRVYGRWINTSNKVNSSPFSGIVSIVIS